MTNGASDENKYTQDVRSYLFVPGNRPERFQKALDSGAHRIIIDLEDAVAPGEKEDARNAAGRWFKAGNSAVLRINGADSFWFDADLAVAATFPVAEIMLPKADVASLERVLHYLIDRPVIALIETVAGLMQVNEIARMKGVSRIAFGNIDFSTDARLPVASAALDQARFLIAMASRAACLPSPIDGVTVAFDDDAVLVSDVKHAREFGFGGKLCIHPKQVATVNAFFGPSDEEIIWAKAILAAVEAAGNNVIQFEGKMIDRPVFQRATYILSQYKAPIPPPFERSEG
ncbi:HpcH/HpaI aldolase/citrate lyase family protein [Neorhizobium tomejilense]|uniref:HpcH/HpaI aldolase/citrate lyase family protein n=1 Tax=Neorhizobium tomejilense TaxID=2093828 RepID=UPI003ECF1FF1